MKIVNMTKIGLVLLVGVAGLYAGDKKPNFSIHELINFPHPLKAIMKSEQSMSKIGLDKDQIQEINKKMLVVYPPYIQSKMHEAQKLEDEIKKSVMQKNMTSLELKDKIDALVKLKRAVTDKHIESLNVLATILTPKQYKQGMQMFAVMQLNKMKKKVKKELQNVK